MQQNWLCCVSQPRRLRQSCTEASPARCLAGPAAEFEVLSNTGKGKPELCNQSYSCVPAPELPAMLSNPGQLGSTTSCFSAGKVSASAQMWSLQFQVTSLKAEQRCVCEHKEVGLTSGFVVDV